MLPLKDSVVQTLLICVQELVEVKKHLEAIERDLEDLKASGKRCIYVPLLQCLILQSLDVKHSVDLEEAARRKTRVHGNFDELLDDYVSRRVPNIPGVL